MRNSEFLDNKTSEDRKIGEKSNNKEGRIVRVVDGKEIVQIEEKTQSDVDMNLIINRVRSSGMSPSEYLKRQCGY